MKKTHEILQVIRTQIMSEIFQVTHRVNTTDFCRKYLLTFPILIVFILNLVRRSLQAELNKFTNIIDFSFISKQVFSSARKKIKPKAFVELNKTLINEFYTDNQVPLFMRFRLLVVDGSTLQLPESDSIREKYGFCKNQSSEMSMARISFAYDPLSGLTLDAIMSPYIASEKTMAFDHIVNIQSSNCGNDLYLFDRGYPFITLIFFLNLHNKDFVMRSSTAWISEVNAVLHSGKTDVIIEINPKMLRGDRRKEFQKRLPGICLSHKIKLRVLIIDLSTGEKEILITSLLDQKKYKYKMFKELYHLRWGGEENYKFHKIRIEVENFSGKSPCAIEQDFHATIFTANVRALLAKEAQDELECFWQSKTQEAPSECKYDYKINNNIALGILKDQIVNAILNPQKDLNEFCESLKRDMKKSLVPIRPGRSFKRKWKTGRRYPMNQRRAL